MSSALMMILTAAMAGPGNGPEVKSGEVAEAQRLDLRGRWEGIWHHANGRRQRIEITSFEGWDAVDEGAGAVRFTDRGSTAYGIYEQHGDHLMICIALIGNPRPTHFQAGDGKQLFILHRLKARK